MTETTTPAAPGRTTTKFRFRSWLRHAVTIPRTVPAAIAHCVLILAVMTLTGCEGSKEGATAQQEKGRRHMYDSNARAGTYATESTDRSPAADTMISHHNKDSVIGTYKGHTLYLGPRGGKYYINPKSGKKVYLSAEGR